MLENGSYDYILLAFFAAFLGWQAVRKKAFGYLWFLLPLVLALGLNYGWATILGDGPIGKAFFVAYRVATVLSCALAGYMYYRDYHKRKAQQIKENTAARKAYEAQHKKGTDGGKETGMEAKGETSSYKIYSAKAGEQIDTSGDKTKKSAHSGKKKKKKK